LRQHALLTQPFVLDLLLHQDLTGDLVADAK
jgi:hypothetical protein